MLEDDPIYGGLKASAWQAAFRPGLPEFSASTFVFSSEAQEMVRIAFANQGAYVNENERRPVYTVAVTLPPDIAVELARQILKLYAQPRSNRSISNGEL